MTEDEKEFAKKINIDKAKDKTKGCIVLIIISIITYIGPLIDGEFDFGMIFEVASLVFLLIARNYMSGYDGNRSKKYIICSMLAIGWILVYDVIIFISSSPNFIDLIFAGDYYFFEEMFSIFYLIILFAINKDLAKADDPIKYKDSTDWFYEKYEGENKDKETYK